MRKSPHGESDGTETEQVRTWITGAEGDKLSRFQAHGALVTCVGHWSPHPKVNPCGGISSDPGFSYHWTNIGMITWT